MESAEIPARKRRSRLSREARAVALAFGIGLAAFAITSAIHPEFASGDSVRFLLTSAAFIGIAGMGQTIVVLVGGIDLSSPYVINLAASATAFWAAGHGERLVWVIPAVLGIAALVGLLNGLGVAFLRFSPIVMTLGMNSVLEGALILHFGAQPPPGAPQVLQSMVTGKLTVIPGNTLIWLVLTVIAVVALTRTGWGRRLYAAGSNPEVAYLSGVSVKAVTISAYMVSALCSALTGLLLLGYLGVTYIGVGDNYLFPAIAALAVGGTSLLGGKGSYLGTVAGAVILTVLAGILPVAGLYVGWANIADGAAIVVAVLLTSAGSRQLRRW
jgi:ribose transport system permease protein